MSRRNAEKEGSQMLIDRIDLETGNVESVISLEEALRKLVPAYYMDRELVANTLRDGQPVRTTAFEYKRHRSNNTKALAEDTFARIERSNDAQDAFARR